MKKQLLSLIGLITMAGLLILAGCDQQAKKETENSIQPRDMMAICKHASVLGGWSDAEASPEVENALQSVLKQMGGNAHLKTITMVKSQIVSGVNYAIEYEMDDGAIWHTVIYRDLQGNNQITLPATAGRLCENY